MKAKVKHADKPRARRRYERAGRNYQAQRCCRLSLRRGGKPHEHDAN